MEKVIPVNEKESVKLLRMAAKDCSAVDFVFGTGGVALRYYDDQPLPQAVLNLCSIRGITHENLGGVGI